jgi:hypothetical protein
VAYADVISVMIQSPDFLYLVEHGDQPASNAPGGVYTLSAHELAARLSYHLWDTMSDDELFRVAEDGSLLKDDVYKKEAQRLLSDPRARAALDRFFADYLQTNSVGGALGKGGLNYRNPYAYVGNPVYNALAGSDLPGPSLGKDMVDDAAGMLDYYVWTQPGTVHDLLTSELSFTKSAALAKIYGVAPWDGASAPPALPAGQRPGLFTRALFLAGGVDTNPILKGVFLRRYALCDTIDPPPPGAANSTITLSSNETTRQVVTEITKNPPCSAAGYLFVDVVAAAFACEASRVGVFGWGDTATFSSYTGFDWHQDVAHQWWFQQQQQWLTQSYQGFFENVFLYLAAKLDSLQDVDGRTVLDNTCSPGRKSVA